MRKYKILEVKKVDGKWKCTFEHWTDCYCEKEETTIFITKESMPMLRDIIRVHNV